MRKIIPLTLIWLNVYYAISQTGYSKEVEEQIKLVENNLVGRVIINDIHYNILERMVEYKVKGVSIAVIQNYKVLWSKSYGWANEKEKQPVTEKTLFMVGSVSKSINSMGVLKLAPDKKIDLNADVNKYLSSWKIPYDSVSKGKKVTTLNLLSHSAGLNNSSPSYFATDSLATLIQELNGIPSSEIPPVHFIMKPNLKSEYSNPGIGITQLMIEDITKKSYDKYIYESVLKPLGMYNSYYAKESLRKQKAMLATGYDEAGVEVPGKHVFMSNLAAGGLWTTTTDLCKFICELQLSYIGKSNKVLSQEMANKMLTRYIDNAALGAFISENNGIKYFEHGGDVMGFTSQYWGSLQGGNGVVVITNTYHARPFLDEIINSVASVYKWNGFREPVQKTEIKVADSVLEKYLGTYLVDSLLMTILKKDNAYYYVSTEGIYSKMHFTTEKDFFNIEFTSDKTFTFDKAGNVTGFLRHLNGTTFKPAVKIINPDTLKISAIEIGEMVWYLLENKQIDNALSFSKRAFAIEPDDIYIISNMAHCYLFKKDYDTAIKFYKDYLNKSTDPEKKELLQKDFLFFKDNGFDRSLMDKVFVDLDLEIPEGYNTK